MYNLSLKKFYNNLTWYLYKIKFVYHTHTYITKIMSLNDLIINFQLYDFVILILYFCYMYKK